MSESTNGVKRIACADLTSLSAAARTRPRLRLNRNLHAMEDPVHRLLNAMEPGSYVRPHRHLHPPKSETFVVVKGAVGLLVFDEAGTVLETLELASAGETLGADLPAGSWHTLVALEQGTVFFETKVGPYVSPVLEDLASWAPAEGDARAAALVAGWEALFRK